MKRFQFGLDQVLRLKRQRERAAELRQQQAQAAVDQARTEVASLRERQIQAAEALATNAGRDRSVDQWLAQAHYAARLEQDLRVAEGNVLQAEKALREAAVKRTEAAREVETLVAIHDREWAEYRRAAGQEEQQRLDELAIRRWRSAQTARGQDAETLEGEPRL